MRFYLYLKSYSVYRASFAEQINKQYKKNNRSAGISWSGYRKSCLSGPFSLNSLVNKVNDIYRLDDCINDGKQNISYSLFCSLAVLNEERKNIARKFKSKQKKRDIYNKYNDHYSQLEPAKKKQRYSSMDRAKKDELLETCAKNIKK